MRKIALAVLFLLSFLPNAVLADPATDAIQSLQTAQDYVHQMSAPVEDPLCENCSPFQLQKRCIQEICAKGKISKSYVELEQEENQKILQRVNEPEIRKVFEALSSAIKELGNAEIANFKSNIEYFDNILKSKDLSDNTEVQKWALTLKLIHLSSKEDLEHLPPQLKVSQVALRDQFAKHINTTMNFLADSPDVHFAHEYKSIPIRDAVDQEFRKYEEARIAFLKTDLAKAMPSFIQELDGFRNSPTYRAYKSGANVDVQELSSLVRTEGFLRTMTEFANDPITKNLKTDLNIESAENFALSDKLATQVSELSHQFRTFENAAVYKNFIGACAIRLLSTYMTLPDSSVHQKLNEVAAELKSTAKERILKKMSSETAKKIGKAVDRASFYTLDKDGFMANLNSEIQFQQHRQNQSAKNEGTGDERKAEAIGLFSMMRFKIDSAQEVNRFIMKEVIPHTRAICNHGATTMISDATYGTKGVITVGRGSTMDSAAGRAIMAHELGHIIDQEFAQNVSEESMRKRLDLNKCLNENHANPHMPVNNFVSEDYSDLVSAVLEGPSGNNHACFLESEDTKESKDKPHSSPFFRLIHVEKTMRGTVPAVCDRYIQSRIMLDNPKSCWK